MQMTYFEADVGHDLSMWQVLQLYELLAPSLWQPTLGNSSNSNIVMSQDWNDPDSKLYYHQRRVAWPADFIHRNQIIIQSITHKLFIF